MAAPASALSAIADAAVDGAIIAGTVLLALVMMHVFKLMRGAVYDGSKEETDGNGWQLATEDYPDGERGTGDPMDYYTDSKGNLYLTEEDRDEAESHNSVDPMQSNDTFDLEGAMKDTELRQAAGWTEDEHGSSRIL